MDKLKANYTDDVFEGKRRYKIEDKGSGISEITEVTNFTREGDLFGANDINATNKAINGLMSTKEFVLPAAKWSSTAPYTQEVAVAGVTASDTPIISLNTAPHLNDAAYVDVIGTSKGKGFQGVVKRHGFGGVGQSTHGQHNRARKPGAIGACSYPAKVFKGTRMGGQMGNVRVTIQNLEVIKILPENNLLLVKGSIPGAKGSIVLIEK